MVGDVCPKRLLTETKGTPRIISHEAKVDELGEGSLTSTLSEGGNLDPSGRDSRTPSWPVIGRGEPTVSAIAEKKLRVAPRPRP